DAIPTLSPAHEIAFPNSNQIYSVDFSPDGRTVYCLVDGQSIDLWALAVAHWPEYLGGLLAILVVIYLVFLGRVLGRRQVRDEPHCRRCNYNLIAHAPDSVKRRSERQLPEPDTLCPECGTDLAKRHPRRGRSTRRRILVPTSIILVLIL